MKKNKRKRASRPKQTEIALTGIGVALTTDKKLIELGDAYIDEKDAKAASVKRLKELDAEILNRMGILHLKSYRIGDKFWRIDEKRHIKVSTVKDTKPAASEAATETGA